MSNLFQLFYEAIRNDDIDKFKSLLLKFPTLSNDIRTSRWSQNPLLADLEHRSCQVAREMGRLWPELASDKNEHGDTALHIAAAEGDVEMVQVLGEGHVESCLVRDSFSMIPLHRAVINGHSDVIRGLVSICPESLEILTSDQDSALQLAVKNFQLDAFQVLVNETKIHGKEHLFNSKNLDGNTVLHLATFNKSIEIVKLLLLESSNTSPIMIRVNSKNKQGKTALEACDANSQDRVYNEIGTILQRASARRQMASPDQLPAGAGTRNGSCLSLTRLSLETRNMLLMVAGIFASVSFTATCNLPAKFFKQDYLAGKTLQAKEVISHGLPNIVYLMVFNSSLFMTIMAVIVILGWPLHFRTVLLFLVFCASIVYIILVGEIMPQFRVRIGKSIISSIALMWLLAAALIFFGVFLLSVGKYTLHSIWRFVVGCRRKEPFNFV